MIGIIHICITCIVIEALRLCFCKQTQGAYKQIEKACKQIKAYEKMVHGGIDFSRMYVSDRRLRKVIGQENSEIIYDMVDCIGKLPLDLKFKMLSTFGRKNLIGYLLYEISDFIYLLLDVMLIVALPNSSARYAIGTVLIILILLNLSLRNTVKWWYLVDSTLCIISYIAIAMIYF